MISFGNKQLCEYCLNENGGEPCRFCGYDANTFDRELAVLPPGSALMGKYIVGKVIGKGGFGITYLAYDITTDKKVALKEYYPISYSARTNDNCTVAVSRSEDTSLYQSGMKKFYDEASLVSKFNRNPNIVNVYEFFYENGTAYFVMELLQGCSLKAYIEEHGCLAPEQALYVADKVSGALAVAHGFNVLHRDIAPDNIMICSDGEVKLIDFGAARQVSAEDQKSLSVILKQGFAPLEQYQKHGKQGPWTDLYSLGATLYYAVTKKCIEDPMTRLDDDEEFQSNPCNVEPQLWEIIRHATNLKIAERYGSADEFRADLSKIAYKAQALKDGDEKPESPPAPSEAVPDIPQSVQPVSNTDIPQPAQPADNIDVSDDSYEEVSQHNTEDTSPYTSNSAERFSVSPPVKKPLKKAVVFGIAGAVAVIAVILAINLSIYLSQPKIGGERYSTDTETLHLFAEDVTYEELQELKRFTNLKHITFDWCKITDLSPLSEITSLESLSFECNSVTSLEFVRGMKNLRIISFTGNKISDLSPLSELTQLTQIKALDNPITSLEPLRNLTDLQVLYISDAKIGGDISALAQMKKLQKLVLTNCGLTDISVLSGCTELSVISLGENGINDLSPLANCTEISKLILKNNVTKKWDTLCETLLVLNFADHAELEIENGGFVYSDLDSARADKRWVFNILEAKGYATDKFMFYATWKDSSGEIVNELVE